MIFPFNMLPVQVTRVFFGGHIIAQRIDRQLSAVSGKIVESVLHFTFPSILGVRITPIYWRRETAIWKKKSNQSLKDEK